MYNIGYGCRIVLSFNFSTSLHILILIECGLFIHQKIENPVAGCPGPFTIQAPYILYTKGRHRVGVGRKPHPKPYAYPLSYCVKLLCNYRVSVKLNHSTLVYIVYYNVWLLALIMYNIHNITICIIYITLNRS